MTAPPATSSFEADLERRFGGLRRLYGASGYERVRAARIAVVGLGGVGSWAVEALARCGVARLVLIDLDHVSESNINRQVQALGATLGQSKARALAERIADIHPGCEVHAIEEFADADNWPALLPGPVDAVIDACDQSRAKFALAAWALRESREFRGSSYPMGYVCCGAAGGKRHAGQLAVADLADGSHDPLLAALRQRLRREAGAPRTGRIGMRCVFSREPVTRPQDLPPDSEACGMSDHTLNCHGYGSTVTVTASFGFAAAGEVVSQLISRPHDPLVDHVESML